MKATVEFREVAKGLWVWRVEHPDWQPNQGWDPNVAAMLELPFEHVIVSHGDPVHSRADFERALTFPPWSGN